MSNFETFLKDVQLDDFELEVENRLRYERSLLGFNFVGQVAGTPVRIDLIGQSLGETRLSQDQSLYGKLVNAQLGHIAINAAGAMPDVAGRTIGLAVGRQMGVPIGGSEYRVLRGLFSPGQPMHYYFPDDVPPDAKYGWPDEFIATAAAYGRVMAGDLTYFDVRDIQTS